MDELTEYNVTMGGDMPALFSALAKAQGQMGAAKKGAANPHFKSKFADLASVLEAILPQLNSNGLALVQMPGFAEGKVTLTTMITHSGGGWICSKAATDLGRGSGAQAVGSAITYLRRYCAQAALALPAVDDDGEAAMNRNRPTAPPPPKKKAQNGGGFQKAAPALPPKPAHDPTWAEEYKGFMATAAKLVTVKKGQDLMEAIVNEATELGHTKRPSEMTSRERGDLMADLRGEVF